MSRSIGASVAMFFLLLARAASAELLLFEDFEDGVIDPGKWSTPYGGVSESGGVGTIANRGYWVTVGDFDVGDGPIEITCDVSVEVAWDFLTLAVRTDGSANGANFNEVSNGLTVNFFRQAYASDGFSVFVRNHIDGTLGPKLMDVSPFLAGTTSEWWTLRVVYDDSEISVWLNDEFAGTVAYGHDHPYRHIAFYNRGWSGQRILIDNLQVHRMSPVSIDAESWGQIKARWR